MKSRDLWRHVPSAASLTIAFHLFAAQSGSVDPTFAPGNGTASIQNLLVQTDGRILAAGSFTNYNGTPAHLRGWSASIATAR